MFNLALTVNVIVHVLRGLEAFNSLFNAWTLLEYYTSIRRLINHVLKRLRC